MKNPTKPSKHVFKTVAQVKRVMSQICVRYMSGEIGDHAREVLEALNNDDFDRFEELEERAKEVMAEIRSLKKGY